MPSISSKYADKNKKTRGWCSGNSWSKLPDDLKVEILCRVPHKPLVRLKCVSKSWHLLITSHCAPIVSSNFFCGLVFTSSIPKPSGGVVLDFFPDPDYHLVHSRASWGLHGLLKSIMSFEPEPENFQDCCNGLLLFARFATSCPTQYILCNPTTKECLHVPVNSAHASSPSSFTASLVFDFRYNSCMVIVPMEYSKHCLKMDVFQSGLGEWSPRIVPLDDDVDGSYLIDRCVYLNGILYMLSLKKFLVCINLADNIANKDKGRMILSYRSTELPGKDEFDYCGSFGISRGSLLYSNSDCSKIVVWRLLLDNKRWALEHTIITDEYLANPRVYRLTREHCKSLGGLIEVYAFHPFTEDLFLAVPFQVQKYNPVTKKLEKFNEIPYTRGIICGQHKVFPLTRCVVTLKSIMGQLPVFLVLP